MITTQRVNKICTATEFALFKDSEPKSIDKLNLKQLKSKAKTARNLQDKWRDKTKLQQRAAKTKLLLGELSITKEKVNIFTEILKRFEKRINQTEKQEHKKIITVKKVPISKKQKTPKSIKATGVSSKNKKVISKSSLGHTTSRNKKNQAKRDRR